MVTEQRSIDEPAPRFIRALLAGSTELLEHYPQSVTKALNYMANHFEDEITLGILSADACVTPSHLYRLFRQEMGMPPIRFLTRLRVEKSKLVLADRQNSVTDACWKSGFTNLRTFEPAFKTCVGCAPKKYRNRELGEPVGVADSENDKMCRQNDNF